MKAHHPARATANGPIAPLGHLARDRSGAKAEICTVMERLADEHGVPLQHVEPETLGFFDEALSLLTLNREDALRAEIEEPAESKAAHDT